MFCLRVSLFRVWEGRVGFCIVCFSNISLVYYVKVVNTQTQLALLTGLTFIVSLTSLTELSTNLSLFCVA